MARWLQFRLLPFLLLASVIPPVVGTYVASRLRAYREHRAFVIYEKWKYLGVTADVDDHGAVLTILSAPWTRRLVGCEEDDIMVNDELMNRMATTPTIRELLIYGGNSDDETIKRLTVLRGRCDLRRIVVAGTNVTEAGATWLRKEFPECDIQFYVKDSRVGGPKVP